MISEKKHIQQLVALLQTKGITDVVISPGSRNAPLINTFVAFDEFNCLNIVDERSAAYFAIGMAQAAKKPVAVVCTSGTAALNYGPGIAEAFYMKIPLVVLTADRPRHLVDQADGQTVRQENVFENHVLASVNLPEDEDAKNLHEANILLNCSLNKCLAFSGPVHINIPLDEPLYGMVNQDLPDVKNDQPASNSDLHNKHELAELAEIWNKSKQRLLLPGQMPPNDPLNGILSKVSAKADCVVLSEHITNLTYTDYCSGTDNILALIEGEESEFAPDLLITFGGQIVSKRIKKFLRTYKPKQHWHISETGESIDTYFALSRVITSTAEDFFTDFLDLINAECSTYKQLVKQKETRAFHLQQSFLSKIDFGDMKAFELIDEHLPGNSILHLGNSTTVRYLQLFRPQNTVQYYGNRGTSGIDGCLSTASGFAYVSQKINTVIVGDLSFFYDSNALWNKHLPENIRIIVINNYGGNIFSLIEGPPKSVALNEHFMAKHQFKAKGLANAFDIEYFSATNKHELVKSLEHIYSPDFSGPVILEVFSDSERNTNIFQQYFNFLKMNKQ